MKFQQFNHINFSGKETDDLFSAARAGDSKAFSKLSGFVRHIAYSYFESKYKQGRILNIEDVDDLSNNVYLSFAEQYHKIDNLEFWLRRVLFLSFISWYKKSKSRKFTDIEDVYYLQDTSSDPSNKIDAEKIIHHLSALSEEKQNIIKMRFYEDMKFSEIAENTGKSEDAVKKMFYRTLEELKDMISFVPFFLLIQLFSK